MIKQIVFIIIVIVTLAVFIYSISKYIKIIKLLKKAYPVKDLYNRFIMTLNVALFQTKIFRFPVIGFIHALVFWGFLVICVGSLEIIIDGITGTERVLSHLGFIYDIISASGDIFGLIVLISIIVFLIRRVFMNIKRFHGEEMKKKFHIDANIALTLILLLMVSLLSMNTAYCLMTDPANITGTYPVSKILASMFNSPLSIVHSPFIYEVSWWSHILLVFIFANYLPYSKHFHVFMSIPNVFFSRLEPLGKLPNMDNVTKEVKLMMNPETAFAGPTGDESPPSRFGVKDVEDGTWKNFIDSLSCTQCGRCTSVCPANITGKKLSPRKIFIDYRLRMNEKSPYLLDNKEYTENKSYIRDYIAEEEIWACTTCNACAQECPVNINHPSLIIDMRRYLVMEEASAPANIKATFTNIENNGAPWQFSPQDRLLWTTDPIKGNVEVPVMADVFAKGQKPEFLFWVGCSGAFDDRYKKVARAFAKILNHLNVSYAVLGVEESCTGDPARRAGNEMLFQMQALSNIEIFKNYEVKKIITICPHCFNTFKNEYPDLDGIYEVLHYTDFFKKLIHEGKLNIPASELNNKKITFHDPCYLGRANNEYDAPRSILSSITKDNVEMKKNRSFALCCGAGGAQMFKEAEKGDKEIFIERIEDALETNAEIIASSCPFCMTMITDGLKYKNKEEKVYNYDIIELVAQAIGL